ncbi:hypothetical protein ACLK19_22465 [Escherichia coli]
MNAAHVYSTVHRMGRCRHVNPRRRAIDESLLDTCWLAIAATDDDALNQRVSRSSA